MGATGQSAFTRPSQSGPPMKPPRGYLVMPDAYVGDDSSLQSIPRLRTRTIVPHSMQDSVSFYMLYATCYMLCALSAAGLLQQKLR